MLQRTLGRVASVRPLVPIRTTAASALPHPPSALSPSFSSFAVAPCTSHSFTSPLSTRFLSTSSIRNAAEAGDAAAAAVAEPSQESDKPKNKAKNQKSSSKRSRAVMRGVEEVSEREVPLMNLEGLNPGQNKFSEVIPLMEQAQLPRDVIDDMVRIGDYATASTREILSAKIQNLIKKYGRKPHDTGSPEVQVACLTARLHGYDRHLIEHRRDINSRRGFRAIWMRRRKLLKYLRKTKYETYAFIMKEFNLKESDIDNVGLSRTSGTQAARIKRD